MKFLFSNYSPVLTGCPKFADAFYEELQKASGIDIAVGYISRDSLAEISKMLNLYPNIRTCNLIIGMHYFESFTPLQYKAALKLNSQLREHCYGEVRLIKAFAYHGKVYSYMQGDKPLSGIIGSDNLSSLNPYGNRRYESSVLLDDASSAEQLHRFIQMLKEKASVNIAEVKDVNFIEENPLLANLDAVRKLSEAELAKAINDKTDIFFEIPIKDAQASNLNVYFGKGRVSPNGIIKPRHWYEAELIVPKRITSDKNYPQAKSAEAEFTVYTDDGWSFKCYVSGDYSKNFRSKDDLTILGKWLKGRLENDGVLEIGSPVTKDTLRKYGRSSFTLTKLKAPNSWFIDFGVRK